MLKERFLAGLTVASLVGCAAGSDGSYSAASLLSATGVVSESQANSLFAVGGGLKASQEEFTPEQEYYLGRAVAAEVLGKYKPTGSSQLTNYVNKVGDTLVAVSDLPVTFSGYHFVIVDSEEINALAAPSGYIFVTKGFVKLLPDEDALAAVLAHEVAHVVKGHGVGAVKSSKLFSALSLAGAEGVNYAASSVASPVDLSMITGMFTESVGKVTDKLLTSGYDRSQEYEADEYAVELMVRAGYDPKALVDVLKVLEQHQGDEGGWYETHPKPSSRLSEVQELAEEATVNGAKPREARAARYKAEVAKL